ncbi:MAG: cell division ATP-binding protein FtsE [Clostridia bacterium]|mgnify:CR=1 FL=1|nr:cell division ATP-binding protein FtsE [Clostridia bacterium]
MIKFNNVSKVYGNGTVALKNINLTIEDESFVFIVGHSGAGKSTLLKLLLCEEEPTEGSIEVDDYDLNSLKSRKIPYYRRNMGIVFQDFKLFEKSTVYENVAFAMRAIGEPNSAIKKRVPKLLSLLGLSERSDNFPTELSGGEQQRVSLARALANNPKIIIADEPTANVDPRMSLDIMNLLIQLNQGGRTVIVITHDKNLVDFFQKRVVVIEDGVIKEDRIGGMFNA